VLRTGVKGAFNPGPRKGRGFWRFWASTNASLCSSATCRSVPFTGPLSLLTSPNELELNPVFHDELSDVVIPDTDVIVANMEHQILAERNSGLIVYLQWWHWPATLSSARNHAIQTPWQAAVAMVIYSASYV